MANFILEIGTEELPARFLRNENKDLLESFARALDEAGLEYGEIETMSTPRRLALFCGELAERQKSSEEIVNGPPLAAAYQADGEPSRALLGFMKSHNLKKEDIFINKTSRGEYVAARKAAGGRSAIELLSEICPAVLAGLRFPKRMRWGAHSLPYARPIRWILALYGEEIVPFEFGPVKSGRLTYGHRIHGPGPFEIDSADGWLEACASKGKVIPNAVKRREMIIAAGDLAAAKAGGRVVWREDLLDEVCGLAELPVPILGDFDPAYLEIPEEVLLTSMQSHQKSFGLRGDNGELLPHFLTVLNLEPEDPLLVKKGWERVLRARLEDARFFWRTDLADNFDNWLAKLENVIYIGPLGSMGDKSRRLAKLSRKLAESLSVADADLAERAGRLAKADLVSGMVGEFDTLQGIMGGIYAEKAGEDPRAAQAIREQYLPQGPDSPLPESDLGAVLSLADKADSLAGCFGLGMIPGGAADPNGLRRCAIGVIRALLDKNWDLKTSELFEAARELYGEKNWKLSPEEASARLMDFIGARLRAYYISQGYDTPMVDAVLAAGFDAVADSKARLDALSAFASTPAFLDSARVLKRVENISREAASDKESWREDLLEEEAEKALAAKLAETLPILEERLKKGEYAKTLAELENLKGPVNDFFDKVMVNCEDQAVKQNRLRLLRALAKPFRTIANFALLQV